MLMREYPDQLKNAQEVNGRGYTTALHHCFQCVPETFTLRKTKTTSTTASSIRELSSLAMRELVYSRVVQLPL